MHNVTFTQKTLVERAAAFLAAKARHYRTALVSAFLFGLLAHGFAFANKLINHDEAASLFLKGATVESGRWGLGLLDSVFPNYSMPWIYGFVSIVFLAIAVCFLVDLFDIHSKLLQALLAGCVLTFPSLTGTFGYMFTAAPYALSFLLAVAAVWLMAKAGVWKNALALGLMIGSLSIYQSYIAIAAALMVLVLFHALLRGETAAAVFRRGVWYVAFLLVSLGLYYGMTQLVLRVTGVRFGAYAQNSVTFRLTELPERIGLAYSMFGKFFTESLHGLIPTALSRVLHGILPVICLGLLLPCLLSRKYAASQLLLMAVLVGLLPLAINCMYLITAADSIHTLVLYSFFTVYLVPLILADSLQPFPLHKCMTAVHAVSVNLLPVVLALIITVNVYISNEAYLNLHLRYENAFAFYTSLAAQIRQDPAFSPGTRLAVVGTYRSPDFYELHFSDTDRITGVHGFLPDSYSLGSFLTYYIGFSVPLAAQEEVSRIQNTPEFEAMPCYPYYGCMAAFGNVFVVKLS